MPDSFFTPTETSKRLGIQTSKLRKYVAYFPGLFSKSAQRERDRQYSQADIEVFQRVKEFGGKISLLPTDPAGGVPAGPAGTERAPTTFDSLATRLLALQEVVSELSNRQEQFGERQAVILECLDRIAAALAGEAAGPPEYRRRPSASAWHWKPGCPRYPKRGQYIVTTSRPSSKQLCSACARRESEG